MNITTVRQALAAQLEPLNMRIYSYIPDSVETPCVIIYPIGVDYHTVFGGGTDFQFGVRILAPSPKPEQGQLLLDEYLSDETVLSVPDAIEADQTLGGVVSSCTVGQMRNYGKVASPDGDGYSYGAELTVTILL